MTIETSPVEISPQLEAWLHSEEMAWLTTVNASGLPFPTPIWFWWENGEFLIFSQPHALKLKNIRRNPRVAINFNTDVTGEIVVVFWGEARIDPDAPRSIDLPGYIAKYRKLIDLIGFTPERLATEFSTAIRVRPTKVRVQV